MSNDELRAKFDAYRARMEASGYLLDEFDWIVFRDAHAYRDAEVEALRRDAERYRWLRKKYRSASPHMDGTFEHRPPMHAFRGRTFDEAIDAAMAKDSK